LQSRKESRNRRGACEETSGGKRRSQKNQGQRVSSICPNLRPVRKGKQTEGRKEKECSRRKESLKRAAIGNQVEKLAGESFRKKKTLKEDVRIKSAFFLIKTSKRITGPVNRMAAFSRGEGCGRSRTGREADDSCFT